MPTNTPDVGLPDVPWSRLRTPAGRNAGTVPGLLASLVTSSTSVHDVAPRLTMEISHCGLMSEAAPYTMPFLAQIGASDLPFDVREAAIDLIDAVAFGMVDRPDTSGGEETYFQVLAEKIAASVELLRRAASRSRDRVDSHARHLVELIEKGILPGGAPAPDWRTSPRPFHSGVTKTVGLVTIAGRALVVTECAYRTPQSFDVLDAATGESAMRYPTHASPHARMHAFAHRGEVFTVATNRRCHR